MTMVGQVILNHLGRRRDFDDLRFSPTCELCSLHFLNLAPIRNYVNKSHWIAFQDAKLQESLETIRPLNLRCRTMQNKSPLRSWRSVLCFVVACILAVFNARAEDTRTIEGQIFIRTRGAANFKLSLVDVLLFDAEFLSKNLDEKRSKAEPLRKYIEMLEEAAHAAWNHRGKVREAAYEVMMKDVLNKHLEAAWNKAKRDEENALIEWDRLQNKITFLSSPYYLLTRLPKPLQSSKTDADGKFTFKVPNGKYALVAQSSRNAGPKVEFYHWAVRITVDTDRKIMLANDNLVNSSSPDSMLKAQSEDSTNPFSDENLTFDSILACVEQDKRRRAAVDATKQEKNRQAELAFFRKNPKAAQLRAVELYPELGESGSPLNKAFVERMKRYQTEKKEFFAEPDWPVRLAKECIEAPAVKVPRK